MLVKGLVGVAILGAAVLGLGTGSPIAHAAQGTTYYFHGTSSDDANRLLDTPTATFNTGAPGTTDQTQTGTVAGSNTVSADKHSVYWLSNALTGSLSGTMHFDWWWSSANAEAIALGDSLDISVWADVTVTGGTVTEGSGHQVGSGTVGISMGATPVHSVDDVKISGTASTNLVVQATVHFVDSGNDNRVHYDSTTAPSSFIFPYVAPPPPVSGATVVAGSQGFANYGSPPGFQTRDAAQRPNSGEPSIGANRSSGKIMYMAGTQVSQIGFNTSTVPPTATWSDVTPAQLANVSEDSILFTNATTNRTWAEDFLLNSACNANMAFTDNDGGSGGGPTGPTTNGSWTPSQCPFAQGPDHPSVGAGPYHGAPTAGALDTQQIVYYCAQNVAVIAGAECSNSTNGGLTWNPPAHLFGATTPCGSIHGHIRVSPDGTMYVPQANCGGGKQGMALTQDNGSTFTYSVVPDAVTGPTDPSVAADANNTIYFGYESGSVNSQPKIAVSSDHGTTWSPSVNVGTPFGIQNAVFSEVIAGGAGRAAFAFLGTTTGGDYQVQSFRGVWYLYVAYTYDGGNSWQVVNATPFDPVQRGCVDNGGATGGTYAGCRNMLDFNDITLDSKGRVYVAYTDGCTTDPNGTYNCDANPTVTDTGCATSPGGQTFSENASEYSTATCTYGRQAALVRQVCGQGLFASNDPGFFEGPACANNPNTPEAPLATALVVVGGGAVGLVGVTTRRRRRGRAEALTG